MKEAVEVEAELENCYCHVIYDNITDLKMRIEKGEVNVTNSASLNNADVIFSHENTVVQEKHLECLISEQARLTTLLPRDEPWLLSDVELCRYEGGISALQWILGYYNQDLLAYLVADRFELVIKAPKTLATLQGHVKKRIESHARYLDGKASPILCRDIKKIRKQLYRLRILDELQVYHFLKSGLDEGVVEISTDPSLEEEQVRHLEHVTLAHVECWNVARVYAELAKKDLPKKLRDEPLDYLKRERESSGRSVPSTGSSAGRKINWLPT
jgi:hypothetical protein